MFNYKNQIKELRNFAISVMGCENVAKMSDEDIKDWVKSKYDLVYGVRGDWEECDSGYPDEGIIYALPKGALEKSVCFGR